MNAFIVEGRIVDGKKTEKYFSITVADGGDLRHELLAFGSAAKRLSLPANNSRVCARASRRLNPKTQTQFWLLEDFEVTAMPPLFNIQKKED